MAKFIVVVLDGFGVGEMPDVAKTRPQDLGANTTEKLLNHFPLKSLPTLEKLGLLNTVSQTCSIMQTNNDANWGTALLAHEGCDTFMGHQEIMGTLPQPPVIKPFQESIDAIEAALIKNSYKVKRITHNNIDTLMVNNCVVIGDNLEADLGQVYNLTADFNQISFEELHKLGNVVRTANKVSRNIAFGGFVTSMQNILNAIETKYDPKTDQHYIGVNAPDSGAYDNGFQVVHLGYGVDASTQVPYQLHHVGVTTHLYGKVADIVQNDMGISYTSIVDTQHVFSLLNNDLQQRTGFFCANIQETDLSGHQQDPKQYWKVLEQADHGLAQVIDQMTPQDMLIVMADHGNDPFIGHTKHTREIVPLLLYTLTNRGVHLGQRSTLADVGATVLDFFHAPPAQSGTSFLNHLCHCANKHKEYGSIN
ncbi:phosphopentomutase [Photobacterium minamisatsumaniensis]|uniref:phosphopentomutase n=1 Tax=Photobacterium minamisatsumaniensis TaxID=2910233 RepID=UPI003D0B301F